MACVLTLIIGNLLVDGIDNGNVMWPQHQEEAGGTSGQTQCLQQRKLVWRGQERGDITAVDTSSHRPGVWPAYCTVDSQWTVEWLSGDVRDILMIETNFQTIILLLLSYKSIRSSAWQGE